MAEALPLPIPLQEDGTVDVKVINVDRNGEIELEYLTNVPQPTTSPIKLPIPNDVAFNLVRSKLVGNSFALLRKEGETLDYNIFRDAVGNNVTHDLYMDIVDMLGAFIGLPQLNQRGTCRISPIVDGKKYYVQTQPEYVDAVSYVIYLALEDKKLKNDIKPAEYVFIDETYIIGDGNKYCRVKLQQTDLMPEPTPSKDLRKSRVSCERETTVSARGCSVGEYKYENGRVRVPSVCGSDDGDISNFDKLRLKDTSSGSGEEGPEGEPFAWIEGDPFDENNGEEVLVYRIDYGGPSIRVRRAHLYTVESVCPALTISRIPQLAFPVNIIRMNWWNVYLDVEIEDIRSKQRIMNIETTLRGNGDSPTSVIMFH